jgi:hypothetical protein
VNERSGPRTFQIPDLVVEQGGDVARNAHQDAHTLGTKSAGVFA